jgi:hypothetical protein
MIHPEFTTMLAAVHLERLRRDALAVRGFGDRPAADTTDLELRLCRGSDDPQIEQLALLEGRPVPYGRMVLAVIRGRIVAALPLTGEHPLRDPFVRTERLVPLLELRAAQLRDPEPRRRFIPRYVSLMRGSIHA